MAMSKSSDYYKPRGRDGHSTIVIDKKMYSWGGYQDGLVEDHDSSEKKSFLSNIDVLHLDTGIWHKEATTGDPHIGVYGYACTVYDGNNLVFFGGYCGHDDCYHNNISRLKLDHSTLAWSDMVQKDHQSDGPMKKAYCSILSFTSEEKDYLFVIGGQGPSPTNPQPNAEYHSVYGKVVTSEQHLYSVITGEWITPVISGQSPPPCDSFTFNKMTNDSSILFGGRTPDGSSNNVYIAKLMSNTVHWEKIVPKPGDPWPGPRHKHDAAVIHQTSPALVVIGGYNTSDCWIMDTQKRNWRKLDLPTSVTDRRYHSLSLYIMPQYVLLIVFGGRTGPRGTWSPVLCDTTIIELVNGDDGWTPENVLMNYTDPIRYQQMIANRMEEDIIRQYNSEQKIVIRSVKCFLTGLPRVGKTTFLRRLSEDIVNLNLAGEETCSSTGLKAPLLVCVPDETRFSIAFASDKKWKVQKGNEDSAAIMIEQFFQSDKEKTSKAKGFSTSSSLQTKNATDSNTSSATASSDTSTEDNATTLDDTQLEVHNVDEQSSVIPAVSRPRRNSISEYIQHVLQTKGLPSIEHLHNMSMIYLVDTGGQPEFHELLPVILRGSALYFIFFSLAYSLDQKVRVCYQLPKGDTRSSDITYDSSHSSIEMIHQLLSSFYSIHNQEVEKSPHSSGSSLEEGKSHSAAILLATYADHLDGADKQARLMEINQQLLQWLESCKFAIDQKFLTYSTSASPLIFTPIDNMYGEQQEISEFESFLAPIIRDFPEVKLPRSFALFHLILQHKFESPGVCSVKEAIELGSECGIKRSDIITVLKYLHRHLGTVLFYEEVEELREIVIVNPNILFQCLTEIIMESFAGTRSHTRVADRVRETGEISKEVIEEFKDILEGVGQSVLTPYHVICLLKHFKLLQKMEKEDETVFFMPCLLKINQVIIGSSYEAVSSFPIPSLLIHFKGGYIPVGMFSALIVTLANHRWELDEQGRYRNCVKFLLDHFPVKLIMYPSFIEIRAVTSKINYDDCEEIAKIHKECLAIQKEIASSLRDISIELAHVKTKFSFGYFCSGSHDSNIPLHASICRRRNSRKMYCSRLPRCYDEYEDVSAIKNIWFEELKGIDESSSQKPKKDKCKLDISALDDILKLVDDIAKWRKLGLRLGIKWPDLESINEKYRGDTEKCRMEVLASWLQGGDADRATLEHVVKEMK